MVTYLCIETTEPHRIVMNKFYLELLRTYPNGEPAGQGENGKCHSFVQACFIDILCHHHDSKYHNNSCLSSTSKPRLFKAQHIRFGDAEIVTVR